MEDNLTVNASEMMATTAKKSAPVSINSPLRLFKSSSRRQMIASPMGSCRIVRFHASISTCGMSPRFPSTAGAENGDNAFVIIRTPCLEAWPSVAKRTGGFGPPSQTSGLLRFQHSLPCQGEQGYVKLWHFMKTQATRLGIR